MLVVRIVTTDKQGKRKERGSLYTVEAQTLETIFRDLKLHM